MDVSTIRVPAGKATDCGPRPERAPFSITKVARPRGRRCTRCRCARIRSRTKVFQFSNFGIVGTHPEFLYFRIRGASLQFHSGSPAKESAPQDKFAEARESFAGVSGKISGMRQSYSEAPANFAETRNLYPGLRQRYRGLD